MIIVSLVSRFSFSLSLTKFTHIGFKTISVIVCIVLKTNSVRLLSKQSKTIRDIAKRRAYYTDWIVTVGRFRINVTESQSYVCQCFKSLAENF